MKVERIRKIIDFPTSKLHGHKLGILFAGLDHGGMAYTYRVIRIDMDMDRSFGILHSCACSFSQSARGESSFAAICCIPWPTAGACLLQGSAPQSQPASRCATLDHRAVEV